MDNRINNRVPPCVHRSVIDALDRLDEKNYNNVHKYNGAKRVLLIAASCVVAVVLMTGAAIFLSDRQLIEKREKEFVDPYAEQVMESVTDNGITMTLNKFAMDFDTDYIYFTLKNENGVFEKQPEFDVISYDWEYYSSESEIESKYGSLSGFTALSSSDYDPENPSDTIHAVLRGKLPNGKMTLNFKGLKSTDGRIEYAEGFSFDIDIGTNGRVIDDIIQQGIFDEKDIEKEFERYDKKSDVMDYMIFKPNKTIKIEGNKLKVTELYISPYQVSVTLEDDLSRTVKVGELEYYPHALITMSTEYLRKEQADRELMAGMTPEELDEYVNVQHIHGDNRTKYENDFSIDGFMERNRIEKEQGEQAARDYDAKRFERYFYNDEMVQKVSETMQDPEYWDLMDNARYKLGIEFAPEAEAKLIGWDDGNSYYKIPDNREDCRIYATNRINIDRPISIDEIQRIYFYKYSEPTVQVDVWVNK